MNNLLAVFALSFSVNSLAAINQNEFNSSINEVVKHFEKKHSLTFEVDKRWDSDTPNMGVSKRNERLSLTIHGGYARLKGLNSEGFKIALCHEMGHIFGGSPRVQPTGKYSSEGQSDYFAPSCFKELNAGKNNKDFLKGKTLTPFIKKSCQKYNGREELLCQRTMLAIHSDMEGFRDLPNHNETFSMEEIDSTIAQYTNFNDYPNYQCRINTLVAGALELERPRCWYNPNNHEINQDIYDSSLEFYEAMIIGTIDKVTITDFGCHISLDDIDVHRPSMLNPLEEGEIYDLGVSILGPCPYVDSESFSGTMTLYKNRIYKNLIYSDMK